MPETTTRNIPSGVSGQPWFFWFVALAGVVTLGLFAFNFLITYQYSQWDKFGYQLESRGDGIFVTEIDPNGPAMGKLLPDDKVLSVSRGTITLPIEWDRTVRYAVQAQPAGTIYTLRIVRQGIEKNVDLQMTPFRLTDGSAFARRRLRIIVSAFLCSFPFAVVALLIGLFKPYDRSARWAFVAMITFSLNYLYSNATDFLAYLLDGTGLQMVFAQFLISGATLFIALTYNLYYTFPAGAPSARLWSVIRWTLLAWGGAIYTIGLYRVGAVYFGLPLTASLLTFFRNTRLANDAYIVLGLLATCAVCLHNYRRVTQADQRNRIKLMIVGSLAAFIPNILLYFTRFLALAAGLDDTKARQTVTALNILGEISPLIVAAAWAYAILKHRALEVDVVLRRGLQYLLAKNVLGVILALPLLGLIFSVGANPNRTLKELLFSQPANLLLIGLAALSLKFRRQVRNWVDRRFFREAYDREQLLLNLSEKIKQFKALPEMSRFVGQQLVDALHPEQLYLYHRVSGKDELALSYFSGETSPEQEIPLSIGLLHALERQTGELGISLPQFGEFPAREQHRLISLGVCLIVPLKSSEEKLLGLLMLGEKLSEEEYTAQDRGLLQAVARQMAVVTENLALKEQVHQELKIKHQVLAHLSSDGINLIKECPNCGLCYDSPAVYCNDCGQALTLSLPIERTLDGKYRLEKLIGKGGMGAVYEATDLRLHRQVALKIITGELFGNREALGRFEREARLSARLNHPNIVALHDYGRAGAEGAYLVMEFLRGSSLRQVLNERGTLPPPLIADWFGQILEGVGAAHRAGIIHRDLKPENVFLVFQADQQAVIKLLDFGIAKLRQLDNAESLLLTSPGMIMGTPNYLAPELLAGGAARERGDIFALGVMLVEMLTGRRPFQGRNFHELAQAIIQQHYQLPGSNPETSPLNRVVQKCLAKNPVRRYATIAELQAEALPALRQSVSTPSLEIPRITQVIEPKL